MVPVHNVGNDVLKLSTQLDALRCFRPSTLFLYRSRPKSWPGPLRSGCRRPEPRIRNRWQYRSPSTQTTPALATMTQTCSRCRSQTSAGTRGDDLICTYFDQAGLGQKRIWRQDRSGRPSLRSGASLWVGNRPVAGIGTLKVCCRLPKCAWRAKLPG